MSPFPMAKPANLSLRKPFERTKNPETVPLQSSGAQSPLDTKILFKRGLGTRSPAHRQGFLRYRANRHAVLAGANAANRAMKCSGSSTTRVDPSRT